MKKKEITTRLDRLQKEARETEQQMDAIIKNDGRISDWQELRDKLNILKNIKIPAELNRVRPVTTNNYDVHIYQIPRYV